MSMPTLNQVAEFWAGTTEFDFSYDDPSCFACGYSRKNWKRWNGTRLQRAHIIAEYLGGAEEPSNIVLLCARCHRDAPMTNRRSVMMSWIRNREFYSAWVIRELLRECADAELDPVKVAELSPSKLLEFARGAEFSCHPASGFPLPGMAYLMKECCREMAAHNVLKGASE